MAATKKCEFELYFSYEEKTQEYRIEVFEDEELVSVFEGDDFGDVLRHAIHDYDPVLSAAAWTKDYFEWAENHKIDKEE